MWAALAYILFGMSYTVCDVPIFSMISASTDQVHERVNIMSRNSIMATIASLLVVALAPQLYLNIGWLATAAIFAGIAFILMRSFAKNGKERYINKDAEPVTFRAILNYVRENKYLHIYYVALLVMHFTATSQTVAVYFAMFCLNNEALVSIVVMAFYLPAVIIAGFMPLLTRRFDRFHIFIFSAIMHGIISVVSYFAGYENLALCMILLIIRGIFIGAVLITQISFTADIVEYGEYKTGKRLQGTAYSLQTFTFLLFNAVAAALAMFILGAFGFAEGAGAVQSQTTINTIWVLFTLVPLIGLILSLPLFARYKLRDKDVQIMAMVNSGELSREEAQTRFSRKF
jgi:Na+/melibiose symporter-like transporter